MASFGSHVELIAGVFRVALRTFQDVRGELVPFESGHNLPFEAKRVFAIAVDDGKEERGGHANSCDELVVVLSGAVCLHLDNGRETCRVRLERGTHAVWVRAGVLIHLRDFAPGSVLLVCASETYAETRHFGRPQPSLLYEEALSACG